MTHIKIPQLLFSLCAMLMLPAARSAGMTDPDLYVRKLWIGYQMAKTDSIRIDKLSRIAYFSYDYLGDRALADSISELAIDLAEASYRPELLLMAYNDYLENNDLDAYHDKALKYALKANLLSTLQNNPTMEWKASMSLAEVYLSGYQCDKALEYAYKAIAIAQTLDDNSLRTESYLEIGKCLEGKNQQIEAFRNYLNATYLAEKLNQTQLMMKCYSRLSMFYNLNKLYEKAIYYKLKQGELIRSVTPIDSVALVWILWDLQDIDVISNNNKLNEKNLQFVLQFAIRHKANRLKNYEFALYRTQLVQAEKIDRLYDLYMNQYPQELKLLEKQNPGLYYRLLALFKENENKPDSAFYFASKGEQSIKSDFNKIAQSRFYYMFAKYLVRHDRGMEAISKFNRAYETAKEANYFEYMLNASVELEKLYASLGDYKNAYQYASLNKILADSMSNLTKKDELLMLEINHETRQRELAIEREQQKVLRRHNIQYTAIPVIIVVVFVILMIIGSFRIPEWSLRVMGFFSFIFLFEFIVLISDDKIHDITQGEPWKILLIKIALIGILLPLHERLEKLVIEYLLKHKLIHISRFSPMHFIPKRYRNTAPETPDTGVE